MVKRERICIPRPHSTCSARSAHSKRARLALPLAEPWTGGPSPPRAVVAISRFEACPGQTPNLHVPYLLIRARTHTHTHMCVCVLVHDLAGHHNRVLLGSVPRWKGPTALVVPQGAPGYKAQALGPPDRSLQAHEDRKPAGYCSVQWCCGRDAPGGEDASCEPGRGDEKGSSPAR